MNADDRSPKNTKADTDAAVVSMPTTDSASAIPTFYEPVYPFHPDDRPKGFVAVPIAIMLTELWLLGGPFDLRSALIDLLLLAPALDDDLDVPLPSDYARLRRGTVRISERTMAVRWGWSRERVSRFLQRCVDEGALLREGDPTRLGTRYRFAPYDGHQQPLVLCANGLSVDGNAMCARRAIDDCPMDCPARESCRT